MKRLTTVFFVWVPSMNARGHNFTDALAMVFYENGVPYKTYMVSDLVQDMDMVRWSVTTAQWNYRIRVFDP